MIQKSKSQHLLNISIVLLITFLITCVHAKNLSNDVELIVNQSLLNDDYSELILNKDNFKTTDNAPMDVSAPNGLTPIKVGNTVYAYHDGIIKAFDLSSQTWLADISLTEDITAFSANEDGIYAGHTRQLYFYPHLGGPREFIRNTSTDIREIALLNNYIVTSTNSEYLTNDIETYENADTFGSTKIVGQTALKNSNTVYGRDTGLSPCDIRKFVIDSNGMEVSFSDSPYHGDYPCSNRTYGFPDESRIIDGAGIVYHALDLTYAGSLAGSIDDVAFYGDIPIVLRSDTLHAYTNTLLESGVYTLPNEFDFIYVHNDVVSAFSYSTDSTINVQHVDISLITPETPGTPVNPEGLVYQPDAIVSDDDNVYLLSRDNLSVFVFSTTGMAYIESFPLIQAPLFMDVSKENNKLYLAYSNGEITQIDLVTGLESALVNLPQTPCGLATAGRFIFACDPSGAWVSHYTFSPAGTLISQEEWNRSSIVFEWNEVNRKMYHFRNGTSPNDLLSEEIGVDGVIGNQIDSPYHTSSRWSAPLCVNPDGSNLVVGKGVLYDATTLLESNFLSNEILGCAWANDRLYTLDITANTSLQSWEPNMQEVHEQDWTGSPIDLIGLISGALIIVHDAAGVPQFEIYNDIIFDAAFD